MNLFICFFAIILSVQDLQISGFFQFVKIISVVKISTFDRVFLPLLKINKFVANVALYIQMTLFRLPHLLIPPKLSIIFRNEKRSCRA